MVNTICSFDDGLVKAIDISVKYLIKVLMIIYLVDNSS